MLLVGTVVLGVAIGVGNVLVPALIKGAFPHRVGALTSLYGSLMVVGATVSAAVAVPVAEAAGWPLSLGLWAVPAAIGAVVVLVSAVVDDRATAATDRARARVARRAGAGVPARVLHRSSVAWHVTAFMGLQSLLFYVALAWLPDILVERGMTDVRAGVMVSVLNVGGLVGVLVAPALADRVDDQRWYANASGVATVAGVALLLAPGTALAPVASAVLGLGLGATVGLAFAFFSLRTSNATEAAAVSGMAQTWGYLVSAFGPILWGALRDASQSWTVPLVALLVVAVGTTVAGHLAGRDRLLDLAAIGRADT
jgi:CP family cyanate transporter-like MFS transporter